MYFYCIGISGESVDAESSDLQNSVRRQNGRSSKSDVQPGDTCLSETECSGTQDKQEGNINKQRQKYTKKLKHCK